jgi:hypothetical protein
MPNMPAGAAAAVDDAMRAAIKKRTDDVGQQSGSRVLEMFSAKRRKA